MSKIDLVNISKTFDNKKILDNINFTVKEGELVSLLGPSGCGKSTTLKIIAGIIKPEDGDILFNDKSVINIPVEKRGAIIVFQDYLLFPHMTVEENISFGLKMAKVKKEKRIEKVKELLELVHLNGYEKKYPSELSGGQKQRVAIARALAVDPKVLLLDEPFSNLDINLRDTMREFVSNIQRKLKITTILVTHDKEEALMMSDKIAVMLNGKIKQFATPYEVYTNPASKEVADFFGEKNYIDGKINNSHFVTEFGNIPIYSRTSSNLHAMIRPEDVKIFPREYNNGPVGKIIKKKFAGEKIYYDIKIKDKVIKCSTDSINKFDIDSQVCICVDLEKAILYEKTEE
ncbi:ABC-type Fe3+/spermidine/putrescine transport systems, ATPase components [Alkalithermobacter thermoalcaliphilus JW-YL-7 = DSM 7308]|uniref:ABC-type quaternary amine transporter n=1 Tax=Alkalithermobacter thermoalcaliphilus JW-YL-7 = DSM 7308 TaxID=1121328 RepID=A0A150FQN3_CLOPD|nr:Fe(3+)-transporting ATPase [[Clostridium] paradoxum JW-YL-7 = DSM 7308]SHK76909.1 ABC-type Fe3+/spermidine/putrescine transport systems, ATPase components [[Clostridium] paradoxum JW-YL-7 = DSM 7308]